jgi:hypothetical protein
LFVEWRHADLFGDEKLSTIEFGADDLAIRIADVSLKCDGTEYFEVSRIPVQIFEHGPGHHTSSSHRVAIEIHGQAANR